MKKSLYPHVKYAGWLLSMSLGAGAHPVLARMESPPSGQAREEGTVKLEIARSGISLEVRATRLARVLDELSGRLGTPIRYANAPEQPVTMTCRGHNLDNVLRCLLGADADLVFQYAGAGKPGVARRVVDVKVLASTFMNMPPLGSGSPAAASVPAPVGKNAGKSVDSLDTLLAMTRSDDPEQRAMALEKIRRVEGVDDATLKAAYQSAMNDTDGDVRAEAISGLALLDEEGSFGLLTSAMADEHPSVRLAALDSMEVNPESRPYYEQALTDADESVRALAALRLGIE
jgi:hypothetical protein